MRVELDVSLENPLDSIDLHSIYREIINNNNYKILYFRKNFILLKIAHDSFQIRIHEDGRSYIRKDITNFASSDEIDLFMQMFQALNYFLIEVGMHKELKLKNELNLSFRGNLAHSFFWRNYFRIKSFGKEFLNYDVMRIYTSENDSVSIKLT